jgi:ribonucleoside-diphosphate reductase alpha chain
MPVTPNEVSIDLGRDNRLTRHAVETLQDRYLVSPETSPQEGFARAAAAFADDADHANRLYDYVSKGWFMFATPVLSNGGTDRGLPISCFLNYVPDSRKGILDHYVENGWLASMGGGIGGYWGHLRSKGASTSRGSKTSGKVAFCGVVDRQMLAFNQGGTRRGSYAAYTDISHPEVEEWLGMRKPTGGDINRKTLNLNHAVNITDDFMECVRDDRTWNLVDPHSGKVTATHKARDLFRKLVETRHQTGEPYLIFIDTANRALPQPLKDRGLRIYHSNLCTEIFLPTNEERTAVCCLSSVNLATYDEWKDDPHFIEDLMRMLDNVLQQFIDTAPPEMWRAVNSAKAERSVGLGAMGWHTFLQDRLIPWESDLARGYNIMIFEDLKAKTDAASLKLGAERGEAPDMAGTGERFSHKMALAPNASSSIFLHVSPATEPWASNAFVHKTLSGNHPVRNPSLEKLLEAKGMNTKEVWKEIIGNGGSVQHLDCLDDNEKACFATFIEINQLMVIRHAADRAALIDQGQSINIALPSEVDAEYALEIHFRAWEWGLKSLYYCRSETTKRAENMNSKVERNQIVLPEQEECLSCQG